MESMKLHFESLQSEKTGYFGQASTVLGDFYKNKILAYTITFFYALFFLCTPRPSLRKGLIEHSFLTKTVSLVFYFNG